MSAWILFNILPFSRVRPNTVTFSLAIEQWLAHPTRDIDRSILAQA
ncbi:MULTISPECIES: hypothetical protein [unclassified Microcoleus]